MVWSEVRDRVVNLVIWLWWLDNRLSFATNGSASWNRLISGLSESGLVRGLLILIESSWDIFNFIGLRLSQTFMRSARWN